MALPADLFLQAWRPSAYVCSGTINWVGMFLIGMLFPYIVVSCSVYRNLYGYQKVLLDDASVMLVVL